MGEIRVLDKHVAELIAAGEVIERPASIVKELLENSIDAGATHITVEIKNGGIELIRVTDDGKGIAFEDAETAFLRHATSKVREAADLNEIFTLGFRGEALASICAVSKVSMLTRQKDSDFGCHIEIAGGEILDKEEAGCPVGTTIMVKNLFYNTPARMKFLKKDVSEANAIAAVIEKIAISNHQIAFKFIRDGRIDIQTVGDGQLISAIHCVFGKAFANSLIPVNSEKNSIKVEGYISKAVSSKAKRSMQYFFLNGRTVKNTTMMVALEESYKGSIMVGKFPACVLNVSVSPTMVDVNVHPAKTEIRFSDERIIFDAVYFACKTALLNDNGEAELVLREPKPTKSLNDAVKLNTFTHTGEQTAFENPVEKQETVTDAPIYETKTETKEGKFVSPPRTVSQFSQPLVFNDSMPGASINAPVFTVPPAPIKAQELEQTEEYTEKYVEEYTPVPVQPKKSENIDIFPDGVDVVSAPTIQKDRFSGAKIIGELYRTYILLECEDGLYLVDKHAAHERLIFNKLKTENSTDNRQMLLEPIISRFSREEFDALIKHKDKIVEFGFEIDDFGDSNVIIRSIPPYISSDKAVEILSEIAVNLQYSKTEIAPQIIDDIYHTIACRSAIKGHDKSSGLELSFLIECLKNDHEVKFCPHGRPVTVKISKTDIEKRFGRIQ